MPDKHTHEITAKLMTAVNKLRPGYAKELEEEQVIQCDSRCHNADGAQVAALL
ncbi:hypothetical protein D3C80_1655610 [compost metagenome]